MAEHVCDTKHVIAWKIPKLLSTISIVVVVITFVDEFFVNLLGLPGSTQAITPSSASSTVKRKFRWHYSSLIFCKIFIVADNQAHLNLMAFLPNLKNMLVVQSRDVVMEKLLLEENCF